jgi:hypothetical protein
MKTIRFLAVAAALAACVPAGAQIRPCEDLKTEIEGKLKDKGVKSFTLEIVPADQVKDQKVVGSCDGGKNKILYTRETGKSDDAKTGKKP